MRERGGELVAANKSTVIPKPFLDSVIVEDAQCDGRLANPTSAYESNSIEVFGETDKLLDEVASSETDLQWRGQGFTAWTKYKCQTAGLLVVKEQTWLESREMVSFADYLAMIDWKPTDESGLLVPPWFSNMAWWMSVTIL